MEGNLQYVREPTTAHNVCRKNLDCEALHNFVVQKIILDCEAIKVSRNNESKVTLDCAAIEVI